MSELDDTSKNADKQGVLSKGCAFAMAGFHMANAVRHTTYNTAPGMMADLTLGVKMLAKHEAPAKAEADLKLIEDSPKVREKALVQDLALYVKYVKGSYRKTDEEMTAAAGCVWDDVIEVSREATPSKPAFWVARHPGRGEVILTVRGTNTLSDALTDVAAAQDTFMDGRAHTGMVKANKWFVKNYKKKLLAHLKEAKSSKLVLCGHSLGAGTAALLTMTFGSDKDFRGISVRGYAFAPPAAVSKELTGTKGAGANIVSVVVGDDLVPRASLKSFDGLKTRLEEYDYVRKAQEKVLPKCVVNANYKAFGFAKKMATKAVCATAPTKAVFKFVEHRMEVRDQRVQDMQPLYPPGRLLHVARAESTSDDPAQLDTVVLLERDPLSFDYIGLSDTMVKDHGLGSYMAAVNSLLAGL